MRYFFDTEFMEDGHVIELLSIGIVREDGQEFYAEANADYTHANPWVREHVLPHLNGVTHPRDEIAGDIVAFIGKDIPQFWAYYAAYDWVVLCQLFGRMVDLPKGWPMYCRDLKQTLMTLGNPKLPPHDGTEHHALADARWLLTAFNALSYVPRICLFA